jgi:hypothetical protein
MLASRLTPLHFSIRNALYILIHLAKGKPQAAVCIGVTLAVVKCAPPRFSTPSGENLVELSAASEQRRRLGGPRQRMKFLSATAGDTFSQHTQNKELTQRAHR